MPTVISVIVCTYNRVGLLHGCLHSLENQTLDNSLFEVIIVDNNSTDTTREMAQNFCKKNHHFRYIFEEKQGLSYARNRGCREAKGEYLAYTDDDCRVPQEWLTIAHSVIKKYDGDIFGGPYYAFFNSPKPGWFKDEYGSHSEGTEIKGLDPGHFLSGGNIFIRRLCLEKSGGFNTRLGMRGVFSGYGEETELQVRMRRQHPKVQIMYYPHLVVYHLVREEKMKMKSIIFRNFRNGRDSIMIFGKDFPGRKSRLRQILGNLILLPILVFSFLIGNLWRDRVRYPSIQNYVIEDGVRIFFILGFLFEIIGMSFRRDSPESR